MSEVGEDDDTLVNQRLSGSGPVGSGPVAQRDAPEISVGDESEVNRLMVEEILDEAPSEPGVALRVLASGFSDGGRRRRANEDAMLVLPNAGLFAVADGMGENEGGELASELAVQALRRVLSGDVALEGEPDVMRPRRADELVRAISMANRAIYRRAARDEDYAGMGTTLTALRIAPSGNRAYVAHVGDSRCYRLRPPTTMLLTRDHTRGALLGTVGPLAAQLSRAVGIEPSVEIDLHVFEVQAGDHYLLCSDGLTNNLDIETIGALALGDAPLAQRVRGLVDAANERGGKDNITAVLVSVVEHEG